MHRRNFMKQVAMALAATATPNVLFPTLAMAKRQTPPTYKKFSDVCANSPKFIIRGSLGGLNRFAQNSIKKLDTGNLSYIRDEIPVWGYYDRRYVNASFIEALKKMNKEMGMLFWRYINNKPERFLFSGPGEKGRDQNEQVPFSRTSQLYGGKSIEFPLDNQTLRRTSNAYRIKLLKARGRSSKNIFYPIHELGRAYGLNQKCIVLSYLVKAYDAAQGRIYRDSEISELFYLFPVILPPMAEIGRKSNESAAGYYAANNAYFLSRVLDPNAKG